MSFTETTTRSWFSKLKSGLAGLVIGPILVIGMIWLLSWNEGRSVQTYRALVEGAGIVLSIDSGAVDPANEGKLVHVSGPVKPDGIPEDPMLGVSADGAAGINRQVEMYQWIEDSKSETQKTLGGGEETVTTYSYKKEWRPRPVDSSDFKQSGQHQNPDMPIEGDRFTVATATLGAFTVDGKAVANLGTETPVKLTPDVVGKVTAAIGSGKPVNANGTTIYVSQNRQNPAIGDLRISFSREDIAEASFIGAQKGAGDHRLQGHERPRAVPERRRTGRCAADVRCGPEREYADHLAHSRRRLARHVYRLCHDAVDPWHHRRWSFRLWARSSASAPRSLPLF